jgi:3-hydroxybutyryl-CoA dehydratase
MMVLNPDEIMTGARLKEWKHTIAQEEINAYAAASGDYNPIHIDQEFARQTPLGGTVAHGMLILAYISRFMADNFGEDWLASGNLNARFKAPARPQDTVIISGTVTGVEKEQGCISIGCEVTCQNQTGEPVIICETKVRQQTDENSH